MKIEILGPGCPKCKALAADGEAAVRELGLDHELQEVADMNVIRGYGVMMIPVRVVALLLAGPALSLPNILVIRKVLGNSKTAVFCGLVVMSTIVGLVYGAVV